jgi:hypothetical protein
VDGHLACLPALLARFGMNEHDADTPYKRSDTEEVRSSNLLTPTTKSQLRGFKSLGCFWCTRGVSSEDD